MAKAVSLYKGRDQYDRAVEICKSESGVWYKRHYGQTPYGYGWSKWEATKIIHPTKILNRSEYVDCEEYIDVPAACIEDRVQIGCVIGRRVIKIEKNYRLPA